MCYLNGAIEVFQSDAHRKHRDPQDRRRMASAGSRFPAEQFHRQRRHRTLFRRAGASEESCATALEPSTGNLNKPKQNQISNCVLTKIKFAKGKSGMNIL